MLKSFFNLFYPEKCIYCDTNLVYGEAKLCSNCQHNAPIIELKDYSKNKIAAIFYGRVPIKKATAFLEYKKEGIAQRLVHELKYKGNKSIGTFIGNWFGHQLKENNVFNDVDYIIPVPLHPKKEKNRGYNQLTLFGQKLSQILNIPYKSDCLKRVSLTKTQTFKKRFERFSNTNTEFLLENTTIFEGKHVLVIDDVITTGATLEACCNELLKTKNITISIASMAYTQRN